MFNECIASLGKEIIIYSQERSDQIYNDMQEQFEFTFYGRVNSEVYMFEELNKNHLSNTITKNERCFVLWSHGNDPVIEVNIKEALEKLEDILAVSPDVWLFRTGEYLIEYFHDGVIRKFHNDTRKNLK
ncbi:CDI toxin immunity protein [Cohnella fermenti]